MAALCMYYTSKFPWILHLAVSNKRLVRLHNFPRISLHLDCCWKRCHTDYALLGMMCVSCSRVLATIVKPLSGHQRVWIHLSLSILLLLYHTPCIRSMESESIVPILHTVVRLCKYSWLFKAMNDRMYWKSAMTAAHVDCLSIFWDIFRCWHTMLNRHLNPCTL